MLVRDGEDFLELDATEQVPAELPSTGDTRFAVRVRVSGKNIVFTAETWAWVDARVLAAFSSQLRELEARRQGSATLESMSWDELKLEVCSTDRAGHVAACGQVGHWCHGADGQARWSVVGFGIPFCPTELPALVREFEGLAGRCGPAGSVSTDGRTPAAPDRAGE